MQFVSFLFIYKDWNRKYIIIVFGINILNIKIKYLFEVFKIYFIYIDCIESLFFCSLQGIYIDGWGDFCYRFYNIYNFFWFFYIYYQL